MRMSQHSASCTKLLLYASQPVTFHTVFSLPVLATCRMLHNGVHCNKHTVQALHKHQQDRLMLDQPGPLKRAMHAQQLMLWQLT